MDRVEAKAKLLEKKLKKSVELTEKRKHTLKDLEEGLNLLEKETKLFEEESRKYQNMFTRVIVASACTTCTLCTFVVFLCWRL